MNLGTWNGTEAWGSGDYRYETSGRNFGNYLGYCPFVTSQKEKVIMVFT
jgi:hypothetical protein